MMKSTTKLFYYVFFFLCSNAYGQIGQYNYIRELNGVSGQWNKLILPDDIFGKISQDLSDIRIFGITENKDTIETPYLLRVTTEKITDKNIPFKLLNTAKNENGYFFTFEIPTIESTNQFDLEFKQENFDWRVKLEGSQNQYEWFTVLENYRILAIKNEMTDYKFTKLTFPNSKFRYFRLCIASKEKPELSIANITQHELADGVFKNYSIKKIEVKDNTETKQTEIAIELPMPVPISNINLYIKNSFDYYRPITIEYVSDSIKTEKGWKYICDKLATATLNSMAKNEFKFNSTTVQKLKIIIENQDNPSLTIDSIQVKGYEHELIARITEQGTYYLTYGNKSATKPIYDIVRFKDKVPNELTSLNVGNELTIMKTENNLTAPLFINKTWLWAIMGLIIVVLGWFSIMMIRNK